VVVQKVNNAFGKVVVSISCVKYAPKQRMLS